VARIHVPSPIGTDLSASRVRFRTELDLAATRSGPFDDGCMSGDVSFRNNVLSSFLTRTRENLLLFVPQVPKHLTVCAVNGPTCWVTTWSIIPVFMRTVRGGLACPSHAFDDIEGKAELQHNLSSHRRTPGRNIGFWHVLCVFGRNLNSTTGQREDESME